MSKDYEDIARLRLLWQHAEESLNEAAKNLNQSQLDGAKERTQYFEKLAIGSGAAIAAIVSFLGARAGKLQPAWILRCSLIALVVAMISALYRNLRYPNYVLAVRNRLWIEASRYQQQCKNDVFQVDRSVVSWQSGGPIDIQAWTSGFKESDAELEIIVKDRVKQENRLLNEFKAAEYFCLSSICIAMVSLVWLALRNF
jgi:hypothetical protein